VATVSACARPSQREDGKQPLYIRVSHRGSKRYLSLRRHIAPSYWSDARKRAKASFPRASSLNRVLTRAEAEGERVVSALQEQGLDPTPGRVKERLARRLQPEQKEGKEGAPEDFLAFCRALVERYESRGQASTARTYNTVVNKLEQFTRKDRGHAELPFSALDAAFLERYETWERAEPPEGRGNAQNTAHKALSTIRTFCNAAIREGKMDAQKYPFRNYTLRRAEGKTRAWLRKGEIEALADVETGGGLLGEVQDLFLWQYYTWGMRVGDALFITWNALYPAERRLRYQMGKTDEHMDLPLTRTALEVARRQRGDEENGRVFALMDAYDTDTPEKRSKAKEARTTIVNKYLKKLAEAAGIEKKITSHTARHSAACAMYEEWKDIHRVKRYLGHSSVTITETYLRSMEGIRLGEEGEWEGVL